MKCFLIRLFKMDEKLPTSKEKHQRIDMFDVAKGISIIQVMAYHFMIPVFGSGYFVGISLATFLFISGLFFKGNSNTILKKVDRLVVPYFVTLLVYNMLSLAMGGHLSLPRSIWFLYVLFVSMVIYHIIKKIRNQYVQTVICLFLFILSFALGDKNNLGEWKIGSIMNSIIFLHLGHLSSCLFMHISSIPITKLLSFPVLSFLSFAIITFVLFPEIPMVYSMCYNEIKFSLFHVTLYFSLGILFMLSWGRILSNVTILAFYGRYSLIVLCYHIFILRLRDDSIGFVLVLLTCPLVIWIIRKYFPRLFGLKPLFGKLIHIIE